MKSFRLIHQSLSVLLMNSKACKRLSGTYHVDFGFVFIDKANCDTAHIGQFQLQSIRHKQSFLFQAQVHPGGFSWLAGKDLFVLEGLRTWAGFKVLERFQVFFSAPCGTNVKVVISWDFKKRHQCVKHHRTSESKKAWVVLRQQKLVSHVYNTTLMNVSLVMSFTTTCQS